MKIKNIIVALSLCVVAIAASAQKRYAIITMLDDNGETITKEVALSAEADENWKFYGNKNGDYVTCKTEETASELKIKVETDKSVEGIINDVVLLFYDEDCNTEKPVYAFDDFYSVFPDSVCTMRFPDFRIQYKDPYSSYYYPQYKYVNLPLEYNKTYFYQAAVRLKNGDTYYSKIESFTCLPTVDVVYARNTDDKFKYGYCGMGDYYVAPGLSSVYEKYADVIGSRSKDRDNVLCEYYAKTQTPDITKAVKQVETWSGTLYFIEECDADALMNEVLNDTKGGYYDAITTYHQVQYQLHYEDGVGYPDYQKPYARMDTIEVSKESPWYEQVQRYAMFTQTTAYNYYVTYDLFDLWAGRGYLLPGHEYKVTVLMAPETREYISDELSCPVRINMVTDGKESSTYTDGVSYADRLSTVELTYIPNVFTYWHSIKITTRARIAASYNNTKDLRIIGINVELVK